MDRDPWNHGGGRHVWRVDGLPGFAAIPLPQHQLLAVVSCPLSATSPEFSFPNLKVPLSNPSSIGTVNL